MRKFILLLIITISISSCRTQKDVVYFPNINDVNISEVEYESPKIQSGDVMAIIVSGFDETLTSPYNLGGSNSTNINPQSAELSPTSYLVDSEGYIDFPQLGKINVAGKTRAELSDELEKLISKYIDNPIVNIRILNYRVTMLGEFKSPGIVSSSSDKINILEAIARSGDMSLYAIRDSVLVIRTVNNTRTHKYINLQDADLMNSEYFYLKPNDIIYALPTKSKAFELNTSPISSVLTAVGLIAALLAFFK